MEEKKMLEPFKRKTQKDGTLALGPNWKSCDVYVIPFGNMFVIVKDEENVG